MVDLSRAPRGLSKPTWSFGRIERQAQSRKAVANQASLSYERRPETRKMSLPNSDTMVPPIYPLSPRPRAGDATSVQQRHDARRTDALEPTKRGSSSCSARRGFARVEPPVLEPLEPFLELSGEDLRRRMFVTGDAEGRELCLRPEYTIPVSRWHLALPDKPRTGAYAYLGRCFVSGTVKPMNF